MTKTLTIHVDDKPFEIVIGHATVDGGMVRGSKIAEAFTKPFDQQTEDERKTTTIKGWWANCTSCVISPEDVKSMDFETFRYHLYEEDMNQWLTFAFVENPHWLPITQRPNQTDEQKEKKRRKHSSGSQTSTEAA